MSKFSVQLREFADKTKQQADDLVGLVTIKIAERLDQRSPVGDAVYWKHKPPAGYAGGFFRGSWQLGVGSISAKAGRIDPTGSATVSAIVAGIPSDAAGKVFYLSNTAPYGDRIESGWSRQAPQGIVGLTAMEFQQIVGDSAAAVQR